MVCVLGTGRCPRPALPVAVATVLVALVAWLAAAGSARGAAVTVRSAAASSPIPTGFVGISTEIRNLEAYAGTDPRAIDPAFVNLLGAIAPGQPPVLRIGGDSTDWSWYPIDRHRRPPGVSYTITNRWLAVARATADALHGKLILGVNLEAASEADAAGEANAMVRHIGRRDIEAIEIGNEPELYHHFAWYHTASGAPVTGRPPGWTLADYRRQFAQFAHAMPAVRIAGPTSGLGDWLSQLGTFLRSEPSVGLTTIHAYPLKHCRASHVVTIPEVLADSASQGFVSQVAPFVAASRRAGRPLRIDEINAISCGGTAGVSDSFATALWMLDTLFGLADTGVAGVNVHTVPGSINAILNPVSDHGHAAIAVQPEYYAMMMFAQAAPPGSRILKLSASLPPGLEAWATRDEQGTVRVVLINQRATGGESVRVRVPAATGPATIDRLRASGLAATGGVTLDGQTFGAATQAGLLTGSPTRDLVTPFGGAYSVHIPAASAATLTVTPPPGRLLLSALTGPQLLAPLLSSW